MITSIDVSQEIFAMDMLKALKSTSMFCDLYNYMETRLKSPSRMSVTGAYSPLDIKVKQQLQSGEDANLYVIE